MSETIIETPLGFLDITDELLNKKLKDFYQGDVIRRVNVGKIETEVHNRGDYAGQEVKVGKFYVPDWEIMGRVFPLDEIIKERRYDLIVKKFRLMQGFPRFMLDTQIYHDFYQG